MICYRNLVFFLWPDPKKKPSLFITRRADPHCRHFPHGSPKPKSPQNSHRLLHRLARVHSPNSVPDSLLNRRPRCRVETHPHPPILFPHRRSSPTRLPTRPPTHTWLGRVNRVSWLGDVPSRPALNSTAFNLGNSQGCFCFPWYIETGF